MDNGKRFLIGLVFAPIGAIVHGFVLSKLWSWFVTSTFTSLPELTTIQAIGIMFVIDFIFFKIDWEDYANKVELQDFANKFISHTTLVPFVLLGFGWIIKLFM